MQKETQMGCLLSEHIKSGRYCMLQHQAGNTSSNNVGAI